MKSTQLSIAMKSMLVIMIMLTSMQVFSQSMLPGVIKVKGSSEISTKPTVAVVTFSIVSHSSSYASTLEDLSNRMEIINKTLKDLKFKEEEIITSSFSVNKEYSYDDGERKENGFTGVQTISVKFPQDKKRLVEVLNKSTSNKANAEVNLGFELDEATKNQVKDKLLEAAIKDARHKADILVKASGYKIIAMQEINYGVVNQGISPQNYAMAEMSFKRSADVNFGGMEPQELIFSDTVDVVFLMQPAQ